MEEIPKARNNEELDSVFTETFEVRSAVKTVKRSFDVCVEIELSVLQPG